MVETADEIDDVFGLGHVQNVHVNVLPENNQILKDASFD